MTEHKKKKLLVFHPTIAPYRIDFFNALYEAFDTRICLQYKNLKSQKFDYKIISDQFHFTPVYLPENSTTELCKAVWKEIKDFCPDVVLTCEFGSVTLATLLAKKLMNKDMRIVVMTDDNYDMVAGGNDFTGRHRLARQLMSSMIDDFIVVSPKVENWFQQKYKKGVWMPIIVDDTKAIANYERLLPQSRNLAEKYNLTGKKVILSVSRLVQIKNLHSIIDAFDKCGSDAALVIVGEGPEKDSLLEHASKVNKDIIITGRFDGDELYAWYNIASVFILASYKEAFGAVTNEALLAGCRAVISEKAGSSCLVNNQNGEVINPLNVDEIANAIDRQMGMIEIPNLKIARKNLMPVTFIDRMRIIIHSI